ncbi:glycoside hydrolase family 28 protein [Ginsengibacter hankyongi]|uniref:Glycoside hydrolase family 28 protein n=1 Tax=Ginsengibacter hankyongi TaxID=2607284 RepID=A0A5J5IJG5_9BACT|nr:glycosyl hydrolase family 28-related protein [Ginsengibacter hankyongi]KAA9041205.1 glycoside hydrolase family 28 protein [Ginsengibacter hankyongi]
MKLFPAIKILFFLVLINISSVTNAASPVKNIFFNVKDYGVKGDGSTVDTKAINISIDAASAAGGGTVYFPAGDYLSGSIRLKNNITLFIDQGATIIAAPAEDSSEYDKIEPAVNDKYQDLGHSHFHNSFIWGENLHDISIIGSGMIWGKGLLGGEKKGGSNYANKSIALLSCRNVIIRDVTIKHGGWFCILATGVDHLTIDNVMMDTNRDGMDIDCCQWVHISNCTVNSPSDDGICLKSSFALGYTRPTKNVTITNCIVSGYFEGSVLDGTYKTDYRKAPTGRIKMGTESNGGFQNVAISNCVFDHCRGLALESVDGALLEDVTITNITMRDVTNSPFFIRLGARMRAPDSLVVGHCRRIVISNVNVYNAMDDSSGSIISGIPGHEIEDLEMKNIHIYYKGGASKEMALTKVPEFEKRYPDPNKFGVIPAYDFFIRHVKNIVMHDITISFLNDDYRPPFILDDVTVATFRYVKAQKLPATPSFVLDKVGDCTIQNCTGLKDVHIKQAVHQSL